MLSVRQWSSVGLRRPLLSTLHSARVTPRIAIRASSLSAIHRGLRRSEKAQYGEERDRPAIPSRAQYGRDASLTERALGGAGSPRQQAKLRKKLRRRDEKADEEEESGRRTRRKRFLDPDSKFGKKSLVYQLKHGALKETAAKLPLPEPVRARSFRSMDRERRAAPRDEPREPRPIIDANDSSSRMDGGERRPTRRLNEGLEDASEDGPRSFQPKNYERRANRDNPRVYRPRSDNRDSYPRSDTRESRPRSNMRPSRSKPDAMEARTAKSFNERFEDMGPTPLGRKKVMMPMNVKYTTAASQFLYGKSVVKAALEQGRRKLYTLYIYGGDNRKDLKDNDIMMALAKKQGVPITIVPTEEQRLMDKMSMGRPHNGFVLETSPLPQLPIKSLGRLEETPSRMGFHVELDRQTREEEAINGLNTYVPRANDINPKPFVLLLNEILDPGNLGAALRTASYLGVDAVGITTRGSSTLTPVVLKSAAGAVEEITIFTVDSPLQFIEDSKKAGWKTYAAVPPPERKLAKKHEGKFISMETVEQNAPLAEDPCILILGNEGHGLPKPLKVAADFELSVPRFVKDSCVDSLNVSVAAALLCHAFVKEPVAQKTVGSEILGTPNNATEVDKGDEGVHGELPREFTEEVTEESLGETLEDDPEAEKTKEARAPGELF